VAQGADRADLKRAESPPRPVIWLGDSKQRVRDFPDDVRQDAGAALFYAQKGAKHPDAKPLSGFGGAQVLEIVENYDGDTYRVVYTVRFKERLYVLHAFQKKSKHGIKTPLHDIQLVKERLNWAKALEAAAAPKR
jgi:phage-related protein